VANYKVIFLGLSVVGPEEETHLLGGLQKKFNLSPQRAEQLLQKVPVVVKKGVPKEEADKYVRVFQEIGGRVRVEEEPAKEVQEPIRPPEPETKPDLGKRITCPQCGYEQVETNECIKCGIIISKYKQYQEMAQAYEGKVHEVREVREVQGEEGDVPWESGEGFVGRFIQTTKEVLFSPTKFFKKIDTGKGYWPPFLYGMIAGIIGFGGAILWQWFFFSQWFSNSKFSILPSAPFLVGIITIMLPFMVAFSILIASGVTHVCVMIVGGNKKGFQMTFRVVCYAFSGYLFGIIPFIGSSVGGIYTLILTIFGVKGGHGISTGRAVLAVLLPVIVGVGLGILAAILIPLLFGALGFFGGMKV
jgi:hypothetical protein